MSKRKKTGMYFHQYHGPYSVGWCGDYDERVRIIRTTKPANEVPIRLRLFRPVKGKLPAELVRASVALAKAIARTVATWGRATDACRKARAAREKANDAYRKVYIKYFLEIEALHAQECGCEEWNGIKLVFPK